MNLRAYLSESYKELRKVNWPTRKETIRLTVIVIVFSLVVAAFLGILDILFSWGLQWIISS